MSKVRIITGKLGDVVDDYVSYNDFILLENDYLAVFKRLEAAEQKFAKAERDKTDLFDIGYKAKQKLKSIAVFVKNCKKMECMPEQLIDELQAILEDE